MSSGAPSTPRARPFYLVGDGTPMFATFHDAVPGGHGVAVLIVPPFGWDDVASYRSRRDWAEHLAASGIPTLRIDLPGTGDSAGGPRDPNMVDAWLAGVTGAATWLRSAAGYHSVAAIGIGVGGLLAAAATANGAPIDALVLWGVPPRGRTLVRELQAFAHLTAVGPTAGGEDGDGLVVNGHRLSAPTLAALSAVDLSAAAFPSGLRALLLGRDGIAADARLADALRAAGATVEVERGEGYGAMLDRPQNAVAPTAVFTQVTGWLAVMPRDATALRTATAAPAPSPVAADALVLDVDGTAVIEAPLALNGPSGPSFGILAEPAAERARPLTLLLLNAGAIRRIGPNRMYVELARRWAAQGVPSLRLDVEAIGDADGDATRWADEANFHLPELTAQVREGADGLRAHGIDAPLVLVGLCSGAHWAFHAAQADDRVVGVVLLNPRALFWDDDLGTSRDLQRYLARVRSLETWRRALRGDLNLAYPVQRAPAMLRRLAHDAARRTRGPLAARRAGSADAVLPASAGDAVDQSLADLSARGVRTVLAFTGEEPVYEEFVRAGRLERLAGLPAVEVVRFGTDGEAHTLQPPEIQAEAHALVDRVVAELLEGPVAS
ncbi:MAG: hypothetical protein QOF26_2128 [Baekduia sp.]|nr:hypothetical protein [Baekduia sp.]